MVADALRIVLLASTLASGAWARAPATGDGWSILQGLEPDLQARLEHEKVVMLQEIREDQAFGGRIHAVVLFERPRNEVIRFLIQSTRQIEFRPELRRAELVGQSETEQVVEFEIRVMLMRIRYRVRHGWDFGTGRVWWNLDPTYDNDMAALEGEWEVHALTASRALARFGTRIDLGPALPGFLQDFATRKQLPSAMHDVRRWIDSGGTYRP